MLPLRSSSYISNASTGLTRFDGENPTVLPFTGSMQYNETLNSSKSIAPELSSSHMRKYRSVFASLMSMFKRGSICWNSS